MELITKNIQSLRELLKPISKHLDTFVFKIDNKSIRLLQPDRAVVCCVNLTIKPSFFDEYYSEKPKKIALDSNTFLRNLENIEKLSKVSFSVEENNLRITEHNEFMTIRKQPLLDSSEMENPPIPTLDYKSEFEIRTGTLKNVIKKFQKQGIDSVSIEILDSGVVFINREQKFEIHLKKGDENLLGCSGLAKARYSVDYLKEIVNLDKVCDRVKVKVGDDYPLKLIFEGDHFDLDYILAPRVMED